MAQRKKKPFARRTREIEEELSPEEWELVDFIEEIGPSIARVYIWRVPKHGENEYIDRVDVSMLKDGAEDYLRDTYGAPCKYFLRFKGSDGRWKFSKTLNIGNADKTSVVNGQNGSQAGSHAISQTSAKEAALDKELEVMRQRQHEAFMALLTNIGKGPSTPDPSGMLTSVVGAFTALKAATNPDGGLDIKKFKEIFETVNAIRGPGQTEENMYTVVKDLGSKVVETVQAWRQPAALGPAPGVLPASTPGGPAPANGGGQMSVQDWIKMQLHYLKQKALADKDVEFWIDYIFDNEEEPGCAALLYAMRQNATFDQLLQFDPEIAQNPKLTTWFKALYDGVLSEINTPVDTTGKAGNPGNPAGNGTPGEGGGPAAGGSPARGAAG
jgi:hypothetical protein